MDQESGPENDRLESWKQISGYLGRGERTVRRWEQVEGLPVHRHLHQQRGSVWASKAELDEWMRLRQAAPSSAPEVPRPGKRWPIAATAGVMLLALGAVPLLRENEAPEERLPEALPLTAYPGIESEVSFAPDGRRFVFFWEKQKMPGGVFMKTAESDTPTRLLGGKRLVYNPVWSPDGLTIAFLTRSLEGVTQVHRIPAEGGEERTLATLGLRITMQHGHLAWTPDSRWILAPAVTKGRPAGIHRVSAETGEMTRLTEPPSSQTDYAPALSPNGRALVFLRQTLDERMLLHRVNLDAAGMPSGEPEQILADRGKFAGIAWTPSGEDLVYCDQDALFRVKARQGSVPVLLRRGQCFTVAVSRADANGRATLAFGSILPRDTNLRRVQLKGPDTPVDVATSTHEDQFPAYSPDGRRVAFVSARSGFPEVWTASAEDGSEPRQVSALRGTITGGPQFSPDGKEVLFSAEVGGGESQIYKAGLGGEVPRRLSSAGQPRREPAWSRDGTHLYFASPAGGMYQIWRANADGSGAVQITDSGGTVARESGDGKRVLYSRLANLHLLCERPVEGGAERILHTGIDRPHGFAPVRGAVYFVQMGSKGSELLRLRDGETEARFVVKLPSRANWGLTVSADETNAVSAAEERQQMDLLIVPGFR